MGLISLLCFQPPPIKPIDNQLSLADIDTIKVVGKGNGGVVQLVQHKWTNQFFALKVYLLHIAYFAVSLCLLFSRSFLVNLSFLYWYCLSTSSTF